MIFITVLPIIVFFMLGGQINKYYRPLGICLSLGLGWLIWHNHPWGCILPSVSYFGILLIGYGEHSLLMKIFKEEQSVRICYGILLGMPVLVTSFLTGNLWAILGFPLVVTSCMVRLGSLGRIGKFDILPTDFLRGLALGCAMCAALI